MPNPHRLSVGVPWVWRARRGRSTRLPLRRHWPSWPGSLSDWLGRVPPVCCSPIIIRPSPTRPRPLTVAIAALSRTRGLHRVLCKHTHTHTKRRHYQTPQTQSISREACAAAGRRGSFRSGRDVTIDPFRRDGWLSFALFFLHFCFFIFNAFLWLMFCRNYDHYCSCFL